jgi:methylmalonyl-CoA/ethylmalonyl-CoA epimerase
VKLDHLGVAVTDLERAAAAWNVLGLETAHVEEVPRDQVRVAFVPFAGGRLELLEPTAETSPVARFLARRGEGIHHVAFAVTGLADLLARLKAAGVRLIDEAPRPGAEGTAVAFLHPSATGGVLVELGERPTSA